MQYPKRLIEVDLPIADLGACAAGEVDSAWADFDAAHLVGAAAGGLPGVAGVGGSDGVGECVGDVAIPFKEYRAAERLKGDFWLYVVFNCGSTPQLHTIQDPVKLGWRPVAAVEHYRVGAEAVLRS